MRFWFYNNTDGEKNWNKNSYALGISFSDNQIGCVSENSEESVTNDGNGNASANPTSTSQGYTVNLTATPNSGYHFKNWEVLSGGISIANPNNASTHFTMNTSDVSVKAHFERDSESGGQTTENNDKEDGKENSSDGNSSQTEPEVPSTVPVETVQIIDGDTDNPVTGMKVLNPFLHDVVNHLAIADLYARSMRKRAVPLMQKSIIPPYGATADWKGASHTIRWSNLGVKSGDKIAVIWYTPAWYRYASNTSIIKATVVGDGTIEFTVPNMGDMAVMSIIKLV